MVFLSAFSHHIFRMSLIFIGNRAAQNRSRQQKNRQNTPRNGLKLCVFTAALWYVAETKDRSSTSGSSRAPRANSWSESAVSWNDYVPSCQPCKIRIQTLMLRHPAELGLNPMYACWSRPGATECRSPEFFVRLTCGSSPRRRNQLERCALRCLRISRMTPAPAALSHTDAGSGTA